MTCSNKSCKREATPGRRQCAECREWRRTWNAEYRIKRMADGICTRCGAAALDDSEFCATCREQLNAGKRDAYARRRRAA